MTLLGKLKLGFRAVVVAVVVLMALNIAELLWISSWQKHTDKTVDNSQAAGQVTNAVEDVGQRQRDDRRHVHGRRRLGAD